MRDVLFFDELADILGLRGGRHYDLAAERERALDSGGREHHVVRDGGDCELDGVHVVPELTARLLRNVAVGVVFARNELRNSGRTAGEKDDADVVRVGQVASEKLRVVLAFDGRVEKLVDVVVALGNFLVHAGDHLELHRGKVCGDLLDELDIIILLGKTWYNVTDRLRFGCDLGYLRVSVLRQAHYRDNSDFLKRDVDEDKLRNVYELHHNPILVTLDRVLK